LFDALGITEIVELMRFLVLFFEYMEKKEVYIDFHLQEHQLTAFVVAYKYVQGQKPKLDLFESDKKIRSLICKRRMHFSINI